MSTPRIEPVEPPYPADMQAHFDTMMHGAPPLLLFRTVARNPRVLQRMMAGGLLDRGIIPLRTRELIILRTCVRCGAEYEWGVHVASFGQKAQWTLDQLYSSVHGDASDCCWNDEDRLLLGLADELHDTNSVSPWLWQQASERYSSEQLVELIMLAGLYLAVSFLVNACEVQHESFAPRFPRAAEMNTARIE